MKRIVHDRRTAPHRLRRRPAAVIRFHARDDRIRTMPREPFCKEVGDRVRPQARAMEAVDVNLLSCEELVALVEHLQQRLCALEGRPRRIHRLARLALHIPVVLPLCWLALWAIAPSFAPSQMAGTTFTDGFESGTFSAWTTVQRGSHSVATVQSYIVEDGDYAAHLAATSARGSFAYARKYLPPGRQDLDTGGDFQITREGRGLGQVVPLFRLYDGAGNRIISLDRQGHRGWLWVHVGQTFHHVRGLVPLGMWEHVELQVTTARHGTHAIAVRLNGVQVGHITTGSLPRGGIRIVQIGDEARRQAFTMYADNITMRQH